MAEGSELSELYRARFEDSGLENRRAVWRTLVDAWFRKLVPADAEVLELASGYGEFLNAITARRKFAVDLNPDAARYLPPGATFINGSADKLDFVGDASIDVVFTSNFLEHLPSKAVLSQVFAEVLRVLRPGGRFIVMGPNIRFAYREYWDFYDHYLPLSDRSLAEGLAASGFAIERVIPQFLPFRMGTGPTPAILIRGYLALPLAWKLLGKQFLVVAKKPG
jgi:SAM-dependent methyltransferase